MAQISLGRVACNARAARRGITQPFLTIFMSKSYTSGRMGGRRETHLLGGRSVGRARSIPQSRGRTSYSSDDCAVAQLTFQSQLVSCRGKPVSELRWQQKKMRVLICKVTSWSSFGHIVFEVTLLSSLYAFFSAINAIFALIVKCLKIK